MLAALLGGVMVAAQGPIHARLSADLDGNAMGAAFLASEHRRVTIGSALAAGFVVPGVLIKLRS